MPSLEDALSLFAESDVSVNIEIKTIPRMYRGIAEKVVDLIEKYGLEAHVLISSFDHEQLRIIRAMNEDVPTAVLTSDRLCALLTYLDIVDADAFHPGCYGDFDTLGFGSVDGQLQLRDIQEVLTSGRWVNAWTCNDATQMRVLADAGFSGIMTDYPNRFVDS
jgi:glycerophosphoryl diester phosphodiesterase